MKILISVGPVHPSNPDYFIIWITEDVRPIMDASDAQLSAEIFVQKMPDDGRDQVWRLSGLYVPPVWRRGGLARRLLEAAQRFIAGNAMCRRFRIYLEAVPFEHDDGPPSITPDALADFYRSAGYLPVQGHPFALSKTFARGMDPPHDPPA